MWLFCHSEPEIQAPVEDAMPERLDLVDEVQFEGLQLLLFEVAVQTTSE
jgi:hypothetical protein